MKPFSGKGGDGQVINIQQEQYMMMGQGGAVSLDIIYKLLLGDEDQWKIHTQNGRPMLGYS